MSYAHAILTSHPAASDADIAVVAKFIESAFDCSQACTACADACLNEKDPKMLAFCIRTDLDCADITATTGRMLSRQTQPNWSLVHSQIETCALACRVCAEECERHAGKHEHCRVCAEACRRCEEECRRVLDAIPAAVS